MSRKDAKKRRVRPANRFRAVFLDLLALLLGVIVSGTAVLFHALLALVHNLAFLGKWSFSSDISQHTPDSPWGVWLFLVPALVALIVAYLVKVIPEVKGAGVPDVLDAIYYRQAKIRPIVAVVRPLATSLTIGSGGSAGHEGPIAHIGATLGANIARLFFLSERQQATLVAAGAGAGIAAAFNAPLAGLLFAVEILLPEVSSATLVPVALATAAATTMGRIFLGPNPAFTIPALSIPSPQVANLPVLGAYAGLGLLLGVAALAGIRGIGGLNAWLEQHIRSPYLRHAASMLVVGLLMVWSLAHLGHYYVQGVGYAPIQDILSGTLTNARLLVLLFFLKLLATGLTLGSGGSGGIFSPSLFLGATLGGAYAVLLGSVVPGMAVSVPAFAAAGMAGMVAGMTGAAMTTIVMIFEMTLDYNVIIPMTVTVAISYGLRRLVLRESMYTWSLIRNGRFVPETLWRR